VPVPDDRSTAPAFTVLLVCTGNICRSALAERLGRAFLDELLGSDASAVRIVSAGTRAVVGSAMHPDSALVLRGLGAEAGDFLARQFDGGMAAAADLTLTMTRGHRRAVLQGAPRALARTFTLREAAALLRLLDGTEPDGDDFPRRARDLVARMAAARARRSGGDDDDIRDPIGLPVDVHQEVGEVIAESLLPVLARLADLARPTMGTTPARHRTTDSS
jgi:protein-tyrosine phosphatase